MNRLLFLLALLLFAPVSALAAASDWARAPEVGVRLISSGNTTGNTGGLTLGLEVELAPTWHTYWRSPGEAGLPASIDWTGSSNLKEAGILWPAPKRLASQGMQSFGYEGRVVLPVRVQLEDAAAPVQLRGKVDLLACADLCIPFTFDLSLDLPAGEHVDSQFMPLLKDWAARVPVTPPAAGDEFRLGPISFNGQQLEVRVMAKPPLTAPELIVESPSGYQFAAPSFKQEDATSIITATLQNREKAGKPVAAEALTLTLVDGGRFYEMPLKAGDISSTPAPPAVQVQPISLLAALLAAFIGGLILNLMPCVLPVLSLKLLTVVQHAGAPREHIRLSFLATAAGIITCFLILAGIAIVLKSTGVAFGWGVQFQHPAFIIPMVAILTLFAASLWNLIHIPLPRFLADAINDRLPLPGEHDRTLTGNFITGMFATILATPCSAPFVGTALGFALAGNAVDILLVAIAMGAGLAVPYLLVAAFPGIAHHMPRPGRWMEWVKGVFGFALLITALWLANVLAPQLGRQEASYVGGAVILTLIMLWMRRSFKEPILFVKGIIFMVLLVAGSLYIGKLPFFNPPAGQMPLVWQAFDEAAIPGLLAQGKVVFIDVTADWCLTCHANKRFVLEAEPTRSRLAHPDVVLMRADWTTRSDAIGDYLKKHGRYGIPFNIAYGPKAPQGVALPELLSAAKVESALIAAGLAPK